MQICISKLTIIGSDNGLSPGRHQAIIWTKAGMLLNGPLATNFSESLIQNSQIFIQEYAFESVVYKWWLFCLGLNVLNSSRSTDVNGIMEIHQPSDQVMSSGLYDTKPPPETTLTLC